MKIVSGNHILFLDINDVGTYKKISENVKFDIFVKIMSIILTRPIYTLSTGVG